MVVNQYPLLKVPLWLLILLLTCPADIMEDAQQQGLGNTTGPPHRAVQPGQSPVKLLRLLGAHCNAGFILLLSGHRKTTHTPRCI